MTANQVNYQAKTLSLFGSDLLNAYGKQHRISTKLRENRHHRFDNTCDVTLPYEAVQQITAHDTHQTWEIKERAECSLTH